MGSYFGSELCPVDIDMDGTTDFLLVAAPFYHVHGQEGRVYVYRLNKQVGESPGLRRLWLLSLGRGDGGRTRPGHALCQKTVTGKCSGRVATRWTAAPPPPVPLFLIYPMSSSHIGGDDLLERSTVDKTGFVYYLTWFSNNCGR